MLNQTLMSHFVCPKKGLQYKKYYLCAVCHHAESPNGQRLGKTQVRQLINRGL